MAISFIRTVILYLLVITGLRVMGKRQIGEMQPSELVVAIMISDLATIPMQDVGIPLMTGVIPIITLIVMEILLSQLSLKSKKGNTLLNQLLRSGTSIGANIHEANYASSKADFINKFQIALKECYETDYWLGLFSATEMITISEYDDMYNKCSKIRKLLVASINTAKGDDK